VRVAHLPAASVPRAVTPGETRGYLKAVVNVDTDRVLGASILAVVRMAILAGPPYTAVRDMAFARPYLLDICLTASHANETGRHQVDKHAKKAVGPMFRKADPDHMLSRSTTYVRITMAEGPNDLFARLE
jgi:hypothetical protein